jgi:hypothetical protein
MADVNRVLQSLSQILGELLFGEGTHQYEATEVHSLLATWIEFSYFRRIPARRWNVEFSEELQDRLNRRPEAQREIAEVQRELMEGEDPTERLSRQILRPVSPNRPYRSDYLLDSMGVNHLHVGPRDPDGRVVGGREILVVWVDRGGNTIYFVDLVDHQVFSAWMDSHLNTIIRESWPHLVPLTGEVNACLPTRGEMGFRFNIPGGLGLGVTSAGTSTGVSLLSDSILTRLCSFVREHPWVLEVCCREGTNPPQIILRDPDTGYWRPIWPQGRD